MNPYYICKDLSDTPFSCPNCGHHFYVKWYKLFFKYGAVLTYGKAYLKCPKCKQKDMCGRPIETNE